MVTTLGVPKTIRSPRREIRLLYQGLTHWLVQPSRWIVVYETCPSTAPSLWPEPFNVHRDMRPRHSDLLSLLEKVLSGWDTMQTWQSGIHKDMSFRLGKEANRSLETSSLVLDMTAGNLFVCV